MKRNKTKCPSLFSIIHEDYEISKEIKTEVAVVGAGVMGATVAQALRAIDTEVLVIDKNDVESGSIPCGGLMKPSRFTELDDKQYGKVVDIMERLFRTHKEQMIIKPSGNLLKVDIRNVSMDSIFGIDKIYGNVKNICTEKAELIYEDSAGDFVKVKAKMLILAMGAGGIDFFDNLFHKKGLVMKRGFSFHLSPFDTENFVKFWAPYKQITIHKTVHAGENIVWAGDGSALTLPSWYDGRIDEAWKRIQKEVPDDVTVLRMVKGIRVFHRKEKPCYLHKINKAWFVSGAGKMGLISAGYSALHILEKEYS